MKHLIFFSTYAFAYLESGYIVSLWGYRCIHSEGRHRVRARVRVRVRVRLRPRVRVRVRVTLFCHLLRIVFDT